MGSNRGNNPKHAPGYTCYKEGKKKGDKKAKAKQIAAGKKRSQELARQAALAAR